MSRPAPTTSSVTFNCLLLSSQRAQHRANLTTPDSGTELVIREVNSARTFPYLVMFGCGMQRKVVQSRSHSCIIVIGGMGEGKSDAIFGFGRSLYGNP